MKDVLKNELEKPVMTNCSFRRDTITALMITSVF